MSLTVLAPGPLTTVQDLGRPGRAAEGIGRSGVCDRTSAALANRLVGNPVDAALLEVTAGGLVVRADAELWVALTGARCAGAPYAAPVRLRAGEQLALGAPVGGLRSYLAVRGGVDVDPVLGSRSTDLLSGLGPAVVAAGDVLPVGPASSAWPGVDVAPVLEPPAGEVVVTVLPGPRADWFTDDARALLTSAGWTVTGDGNRVGLRLSGPELTRARDGELASEGMERGALQVPPSGQPVLFLADHPVTGGYPVIGYVAEPDVDRCGQLTPGQVLRFRAGR
ncbi:biotin-dependent carboxyltransferase family protein [Modestobacter sp. Leaf380]|uniref:5-oxoprolinase subunit C family protein n=1 Tax=Modestobacter sp. Leaf380 TaxID=1736356 RepID=UPI0006F1D908|nr:biotin-dependent carboxyltransferase family protein [Modestobacter sp. Leaf380]KQS66035.1 allophanate hydrolase [Modestobacter sp. Leaf380]